MKTIAAVVLSLVGLAAPVAQSPVPVKDEPKHQFKFENEYVRVFDVVVPPGEGTLFHTHSNDYVFVTIGDAALKAEVQGGTPSDLILKNGEARFSKAPVIHRINNPSKTPFRNITIEILKNPEAGAEAAVRATNVTGRSSVLENDRVVVERLVLEPGQATGMHADPLMCLAVIVSGGKLSVDMSGEQPQTLDVKPGEAHWLAEKRTYTVKNIGSTRFEAVEVQWKEKAGQHR